MKYISFYFALVLGLIIFPLSLTGFSLKYYPGDLGDTRFNIYLLEHGYQFLSGKHEYYWNAPFMYPFTNVITLSDNLLGTVPLYSAFRMLGFDLFTSFQLWLISIFALNFTAAYWLFNWLLKNSYAAAIAAFIFAFSISLQSQMAHAQVFARFFIPLSFLFLLKFGKSFKPRHFFLSFLCIVGQFYCGIYLGMLTILPFIMLAIFLVIINYKQLFKRIRMLNWWGLIIVSTSINLTLVYKLMWPYYERSLILLPPSYESIFITIPKVVSYFFAKNGSLIWGSLESVATDIPAWYDHQLFPGLMVYLSLVTAAIILLMFKQLNRWILAGFLCIGFLTFLFFIRNGDKTLYTYIYQLPGFSSLRSMTRIIGVELLFFGIAAGVFVKYLIEKFLNWKFSVFILIMTILVIDNFVSPSSTYRSSKAIAMERVENLKSKINHLPQGSIISYEPELVDNSIAMQLDAMLAAQSLHLVCVNGYSATAPSAFTPYWVNPNAENRKYWLSSTGVNSEVPVVIK